MRVRVSLDFDILIESFISLCIMETVGAIFREYKPWIVLLITQWKTNVWLFCMQVREVRIAGCDLVFLAKSKDGDHHQEMIWSFSDNYTYN
jgi:hypothetical protein